MGEGGERPKWGMRNQSTVNGTCCHGGKDWRRIEEPGSHCPRRDPGAFPKEKRVELFLEEDRECAKERRKERAFQAEGAV